MSKIILITGATGQQGGAFISALLSSPEAATFAPVAVTRNPSSAAAVKLANKGVKVVQGDLNDVPTIFNKVKEAAGGVIWGVFAHTTAHGFGASPAKEEAQGKALIDASITHGVQYFVYPSIERGGEEHSWDNPTNIPHFVSKHNTERYLRDAAGDKMMWTVLRPTAFMENWKPGQFGQLTTTLWRLKNPSKPLQLVSCSDIGIVGSICFHSPSKYNHRALGLAGSDITFDQAMEVFKQKTSKQMPGSYEFLARALLWAVPDVDLMFSWFAENGYKADIQELQKIHPGLMSWDDWLEKESGWTDKN